MLIKRGPAVVLILLGAMLAGAGAVPVGLDAVGSSATVAVVIDAASPRVAMLKGLHLRVTRVDDVLAALNASAYHLAIIDSTPAHLLTLVQHQTELNQFTDAGGWVMLWGVTPDGLASFDKLVGVEHIMRPVGMEKVAATATPSELSAGIVSSDLHFDSNRWTPEPAAVRFLADDAWSYAVDLEDIAPFCQLPPPKNWGQPQATLGGDHWPGNMVTGIDDYWRFSFTIPLGKPQFTSWTIKLPKKEPIDGFSLERESLFSRITKVHLSFPGVDAKPVDLDVTQDARQDFEFAPVMADSVGISLETDGKNKALTGVRNLRLKVQRSAEYHAEVRPLASIGVLVAYLRGKGGVVLNEMNVPPVEAIASNGEKKSAILGALLRNLHAPFDSSAKVPLRKVEWLQKGTAWEDPGNWSAGAVPGSGDIACFPAAHDSVATVNPVVSASAEVGGLEFDDDYGGRAGRTGHPLAPGVKDLHQLIPSWVVDGTGTLSVGAGGINVIGHRGSDVVHCNLRLAVPQTWRIGGDSLFPNILIEDATGNPFNFVLLGQLSGGGHWTKEGAGRVYYASNTPPTFTGGLTVRGAAVEWAMTKLKSPGTYQFGSGVITLDGGSFCFGANDTQSKNIVEITNPIAVTGNNGMLEYAAETIGPPPGDPPLVRYTGPLQLAGNLKLAHSTIGVGNSGLDYLGPIVLDQSASRTLGLAMGDFVTGWTLFPTIRGDIHDGPGPADNPLVIRSLINPFRIDGAHSDYHSDTVIDTCGSRMFTGSADALVEAGLKAVLGKGTVRLLPGAHLNLTNADNIARGSIVELQSDVADQSVLGVGYDGVPALTPRSTGILAIETRNFDAISSLANLGDGTMRLGSFHGGAFTGKSLAPGAGNLYRLGGGGANRMRNPASLDIREPVLVGDAGVEVGSTGWWGNSSVMLSGANTFTGPLTVQGPPSPSEYDTYLVSVLEGIAQTTSGASPFGSAKGSVNLNAAMLTLSGVPGGQPVAKGLLNFSGHSAVQFDSTRGPTSLTFRDLHRNGRGVVTIRSAKPDALGAAEQLHITGWTDAKPVLDPYILSLRAIANPPAVDFMKFDRAKGLMPFDGYVTDPAKAQPEDVLQLGPINLAKAIHIKDLKATGPLSGPGPIAISAGGLLARGDIQPAIDFENAEGVVYGTCNLLGKVSGKNGITFINPIAAARGNSALLNPANDFTGPVTINGTVLIVQLDSQTPDGKDLAGSLGNLSNNITLDGGFLDWVTRGDRTQLAATRTITLEGCGGGFYFGNGDGLNTHIRARITGPGVLTQFIEEGQGLIIDNPNNDYSGGTKICAGLNFGLTVGPLGKLGAGPVALDPETMLVLQGDHNIDSHARLRVALGGIVRCQSSAPAVGSLAGAGNVYFDAPGKSTFAVGSDDSDFTFYGSLIEEHSGVASVEKKGAGAWTLFGRQRYTGPTTITSGALDLRGAVAGDVNVSGNGALAGNGTVAGNLMFQPQSTLRATPALDADNALKVMGQVTLDKTMTLQIPPTSVTPLPDAHHWILLTARGGIKGDLPAAPKGYQLMLDAHATTLELLKP